jgi:uncharacterized protein (TIGR02246 family)
MVRADIETVNREIGNAFSRGDAAAIAAFYTDDAVVMPPNSKMIKGRKAIEEFWKGAMGMGVRSIQLDTLDVQSGTDLAYEIGNATMIIQPQGGKAATDTVKYVVVWKRQPDGSCKLAADIWNSLSS